MKKCIEKGYAKINLHLDVTGRLEGGYHRVETVMQTLSLCDEITMTLSDSEGISVTCDVEGVPLDARNLAVRAANLFFDAFGTRCGLSLDIRKQIPMAAGMAGGSADAAAVLRGLNRLFDYPFSTEELCVLGSRLGADVPFCIVGGTAYADGRGDRLHPFPTMPDCYVVCACEGESVSTPWAYSILDQAFDDFKEGGAYVPRGVESLRKALEMGDPGEMGGVLFNIFEEPVLSRRPVAARIRQLLLESGAITSMMSGSGPSVFGIFGDEAGRERAVKALSAAGFRAYSCRPIGTIEE